MARATCGDYGSREKRWVDAEKGFREASRQLQEGAAEDRQLYVDNFKAYRKELQDRQVELDEHVRGCEKCRDEEADVSSS